MIDVLVSVYVSFYLLSILKTMEFGTSDSVQVIKIFSIVLLKSCGIDYCHNNSKYEHLKKKSLTLFHLSSSSGLFQNSGGAAAGEESSPSVRECCSAHRQHWTQW